MPWEKGGATSCCCCGGGGGTCRARGSSALFQKREIPLPNGGGCCKAAISTPCRQDSCACSSGVASWYCSCCPGGAVCANGGDEDCGGSVIAPFLKGPPLAVASPFPEKGGRCIVDNWLLLRALLLRTMRLPMNVGAAETMALPMPVRRCDAVRREVITPRIAKGSRNPFGQTKSISCG